MERPDGDHDEGSNFVLIVRSLGDGALIGTLAFDLAARGYTVRTSEPGPDLSVPQKWLTNGTPELLVVFPHADRDGRSADVTLHYLRRVVERGLRPIVIAPIATELPSWVFSEGVRYIVRTCAPGLDRDRVFASLFAALLAPLPAAFDLRVMPSHVEQPTGVTWWDENVLVADSERQHIVRLGPNLDESIVYVGLDDPGHIHVDRSKLLIADRGSDQILRIDLKGPLGGNAQVVSVGRPGLTRPHGVYQAHGRTVIADTDNHRALMTPDDVWRRRSPRWQALLPDHPFYYPCGVHIGCGRIWVVDTFNHRLAIFDLDGDYLGSIGELGTGPGQFSFPVGVVAWRENLFVAEGGNERLHWLRLDAAANATSVCRALGKPWLGAPFGLSINRENRLAVSDSRRRCVWILDSSPPRLAPKRRAASGARGLEDRFLSLRRLAGNGDLAQRSGV